MDADIAYALCQERIRGGGEERVTRAFAKPGEIRREYYFKMRAFIICVAIFDTTGDSTGSVILTLT